MESVPLLLWYAQPDRRLGKWREHPVLAREAIAAGAQGIIFHEQNFDPEEFLETALHVKAVCDKAGVPLYIRDDVVAAFVAGTGVTVPLSRVAGAQKLLEDRQSVLPLAASEADVQGALAAGAVRLLRPAQAIAGTQPPFTFTGAEIYACLMYEKNN